MMHFMNLKSALSLYTYVYPSAPETAAQGPVTPQVFNKPSWLQILWDSLSIFVVPLSCGWILIEQFAGPLFTLKLSLFGTPSLSFFQNVFLLSSFCLVFIIYCSCHLLPKPDKGAVELK